MVKWDSTFTVGIPRVEVESYLNMDGQFVLTKRLCIFCAPSYLLLGA